MSRLSLSVSALTSHRIIEVIDWRSPSEWRRVWRYYQTGVANTLFGYGLFSLLVTLEFNMYVAQALSHVAGMAFNYFSYSRYAFRDRESSAVNFILSYIFNYLVSLLFIWAASQITESAYAAGLISIAFTSVVNYFVLKLVVFRRARAPNNPA
ncbi:MAG: GtrA family protein [Proteobacteria bacterium]|nr:MAG: GtrA family protein [Pseudomonadota bacterium]